MKITLKKLQELNACEEGMKWFEENYKTAPTIGRLTKKLLGVDKFSWANWLITRLFCSLCKVDG